MSQPARVRGLDTLRFILASWVVLSHNGHFPLLSGIDTSTKFGRFLNGLYGATINGAAAVIVFFVISGFCIHFPYRFGERVNLLQYYPRRYLRILIPLGVSILIAKEAGSTVSQYNELILWSIVCEEIYYLIYPMLVWLRWTIGWRLLLTLSAAGAFAVACAFRSNGDYHTSGWRLTWVLGLPCWLLGCKLAEESETLFWYVSNTEIWLWRFLLWMASCICLVLQFHSPIGYPYTLDWFAVFSYFWLKREICFFRRVQPPPLLEWGGKWSYSIYLMHISADAFSSKLNLLNLGYILNWFMRVLWTYLVCYVFYLTTEKPSHIFARWIGNLAKGRTSSSPRCLAQQ